YDNDGKKINCKEEIETFLDSYYNCNVNTKLKSGTIEMKQKTRNIYKTISNIIWESYDKHCLSDFIFLNKKYFYALLICNLINKVKTELEDTNIECIEFKKILDPINTSIIYTGNRSFNIIVFEILFGYFIRNEQYNLYKNIISGDEDNN